MEFPYLDWYKNNYALSGITLSSTARDQNFDKYLMKFSYELKQLVSEHGELAENAFSSFLSPTLKDFREFLKDTKTSK